MHIHTYVFCTYWFASVQRFSMHATMLCFCFCFSFAGIVVVYVCIGCNCCRDYTYVYCLCISMLMISVGFVFSIIVLLLFDFVAPFCVPFWNVSHGHDTVKYYCLHRRSPDGGCINSSRRLTGIQRLPRQPACPDCLNDLWLRWQSQYVGGAGNLHCGVSTMRCYSCSAFSIRLQLHFPLLLQLLWSLPLPLQQRQLLLPAQTLSLAIRHTFAMTLSWCVRISVSVCPCVCVGVFTERIVQQHILAWICHFIWNIRKIKLAFIFLWQHSSTHTHAHAHRYFLYECTKMQFVPLAPIHCCHH